MPSTARLLPAALLLLFASDPARAQQSPAPVETFYGTATVRERPLESATAAVTVIDREEIEASGARTVADLLRLTPGVDITGNGTRGGFTTAQIRGGDPNFTLVLLDGVPIADPFFGYLPFNALVPDRLAGIRVTRGGGSGPFGAGAVAGTIELVSAGRRDLPLLAAEALYGSRDSESFSASLSPDLGRGFATLSGKFERGDGFYTTPDSQRVAATVPARYRDWSAGARAVAPIGPDTELQFRGLLFGDNRTLRFRGADSSSEGEDASIRLVHRGAWQVDALAYVQARNFTNKVISATSFKLTLNQRNTPATGIGGKVEVRPPVGADNVLRIGGDFRLADGQLFEDAYASSGAVTARRNAGGNSSVAGLFVEDDWTLGKVVLTGGARVDRWTLTNGFFHERNGAGAPTSLLAFPDRSGTEFTGRGGLLYRPVAAVALRAAAYTGFRLPTLNELYRPFTVFPVTTQANANLKPERLRGAEGGIDVSPAHGLTLSGTVFYNELTDAIANVTIGTNLRRRQNVKAIAAKGVEANIVWRRGAMMLEASYAYSDSKVKAPGTALDGLIPAQSPRHAASATLAWAPKAGPMLSATVRYVGDQYEDDLQTGKLPAATTVDLFGKMPIARGFSAIVRAENVFDATVETRNQAGSIDLGTPRTLWIGVRYGG